MKKTLRFLTLGVAMLIGIVAFAMPANAQDDEAKQKLVEECNKIYNEKFLKFRKDNQPEAYNAAKEWLGKCTTADAPEIEKYLKEWVTKYEWGKLQVDFDTSVAKNDFPNIFKYGRDILAKTPEEMSELIRLKAATGNENVGVTMRMGFSGFEAEKKNIKTYRNDAATYSKAAVQMIESGKTPEKWAPFRGKDDSLGYLYYTLGITLQDSAPKESAAYFYKSLKFETPIKSTPAAYLLIGNFYRAEYLKVNKMIQDKCVGVPDNEECKAFDKEEQAWLDRWADTLARAISLGSKSNPPPAGVDEWTKLLNEIFKNRYKLDEEKPREEAVKEYVNSVQTKPFPDPSTKPEPTPVREIKQDTATTSEVKPDGGAISGTATTDVAVGNGNGNGNGAAESKSNGTANGSATASADSAKPAVKKTPAKSKNGKKRP